MQKKDRTGLAILGSTGSIGTQTLEVVDQNPNAFEVVVLTANNNAELLVEQAKKYKPDTVVIANEEKYSEVKTALEQEPIKVFTGKDALEQVVTYDTIDTVLTAMVGFSGLLPTISAVKSGKNIALANKETLVVAGHIITKLARQHKAAILPVDSEHSAIFQCITGELFNPIEKIYLTASGGPFRGKSRDELVNITKEDALKHPNWEMGAKITIDSASMMNKGLEAIEARWLFQLEPEKIDIIVHPQSIIHSMVQFEDGSMKAQMGLPDMRVPIQYALTFPERLKADFPRFSFMDYPQLTFEQPDFKTFKNLSLAFNAMKKGGNMPCLLNAANEVAVAEFLQDNVSFLEMPDLIEQVMEKSEFIKDPTIDELVRSDENARIIAHELLEKVK